MSAANLSSKSKNAKSATEFCFSNVIGGAARAISDFFPSAGTCVDGQVHLNLVVLERVRPFQIEGLEVLEVLLRQSGAELAFHFADQLVATFGRATANSVASVGAA